MKNSDMFKEENLGAHKLAVSALSFLLGLTAIVVSLSGISNQGYYPLVTLGGAYLLVQSVFFAMWGTKHSSVPITS